MTTRDKRIAAAVERVLADYEPRHNLGNLITAAVLAALEGPEEVPEGCNVWECRIVVREPIPDGFDAPPRRAAIEAVLAHGIDVEACFSGWGGRLPQPMAHALKLNPPKPDYPAVVPRKVVQG